MAAAISVDVQCTRAVFRWHAPMPRHSPAGTLHLLLQACNALDEQLVLHLRPACRGSGGSSSSREGLLQQCNLTLQLLQHKGGGNTAGQGIGEYAVEAGFFGVSGLLMLFIYI